MSKTTRIAAKPAATAPAPDPAAAAAKTKDQAVAAIRQLGDILNEASGFAPPRAAAGYRNDAGAALRFLMSIHDPEGLASMQAAAQSQPATPAPATPAPSKDGK